MAESTTDTDALLELARVIGELKDRVEEMEKERASRSEPITAATLALKSAVDGLTALGTAEVKRMVETLDARVKALEEKR